MASELLKEYNLALHVKLSNKPEQHHVSFTAVRDLKPETEWLALRDFDDFEELEDTDKILLLDCTSLPLSNSLATLSPKNRVLAVLCVCRTVSEQELKMSVDEMTSEGHPPLLFLLEKSPEVINLKELLLLNPYDVECTISEEQSSSQLTTSDAYPSHKLSDDGSETFSEGKLETMIADTLENLLFTKEREDDQIPLVLCKNPHLLIFIVNFLHQKVTMYSPQSKKELRGILNKISKYLRNKVIFYEHVQVDWPLYLMIFSEINSFYDSTKDSKENQALEAMEFILDRFLKVPPDVIATSIRYFAIFSQDNAYIKLRKIENLNNELIQLFNTQLFGRHKAGSKHYHMKQISKPQDLETKLLWYNVIVLCNQYFKIPGRSRWFEYILQYVEYDQLSVFENSILNSIRVYGIEFGLKLGLSFEQRFLLSTLMRWVSASINPFTFHNFNTVLEFILRWEYEVTEIVDFISTYLIFITEFIRSKKSTFDYLLQENPKATVHIMCIIMSNLATLTCTASTRDVQEITKKSSLEVCRKYWLDIFKLILSSIIHCFQDKLYNPEEFALLMRNFYDLIKIPTSPESLIKPWIREYKKEVIAMVVKQSHRYDIAMFHEILRRFSVNLLSRIAIYEYFMKFHPLSKVNLKDAIWDDLLQTIFAIKDPPKSIFVALRRIFEQYILRDSGYEFICDCLSFDLPAYGKEYVPTEKEDKQIPKFMSVVERECRQNLRFKVHENLSHLLDLIPKLRFPSLLQITILDPLCRAIAPDQSLLSSPDKSGYCKSLIISLETISHHQTQKLTLEQLKTSNQHYYLWKILSVISRGLRFDQLEYSKFPYMVKTLLFIYNKLYRKLHGFGDYAWEDKNLNNFIEYCKRSSSIVHKQHERIMEGDCTLLEYTEIVNNLQNLNQLFKNCYLPTIDTEVIQEKIEKFGAITEEMRTILFLQLEVENEMKFAYLPVFLEENQTNVPEGIRREIEMLFSIHHAQHINKQNKIVSIPSITPNEVISLNDFNGRCQIVIDCFKMFSLPLFENSKSSVHEFLAHFALRENVLFTACLHKCQQDKLSGLKEANSVPYLSMDQFVESLKDCYQFLNDICNGAFGLIEVESICDSFEFLNLNQIVASFFADSIFIFPKNRNNLICKIRTLNLLSIPPFINKISQSMILFNEEYKKSCNRKADKDPVPFDMNTQFHLPTSLIEVIPFIFHMLKYIDPLHSRLIKISPTLKITWRILSNICDSLNLEEYLFVLINISISFQIIVLYNKLNDSFPTLFVQDEFDSKDFKSFSNSTKILIDNIQKIIQELFSKKLIKSHIIIIKNHLDIFNSIMTACKLEPIEENQLSISINEIDNLQREIKKSLFFSPQYELKSDNEALIPFLKKFSVSIPVQLEEYAKGDFDFDSNDVSFHQLESITSELMILPQDVFHFISFFCLNENLLFFSILRLTTYRKKCHLMPDRSYLTVDDFIECVNEVYDYLHGMCIGDCTFSQVQALDEIELFEMSEITNNLAEFHRFSPLLIDGFPSLCLFELCVYKNCVPSILNVCEDFNLKYCLSSLDFRSLKKHSTNLSDIFYCEKITLPLAKQLVRDIKHLTCSMPTSKLRIFPIISHCCDVYIYFNDMACTLDRDMVEVVRSKILQDAKLEEFHALISRTLLQVFDILAPFFTRNLNLDLLFNLFSELKIDIAEAKTRLMDFKDNINIFKQCFKLIS